jgi:hypothetical protein
VEYTIIIIIKIFFNNQKFVKEIKRIHENKDFFIDFYKKNKERFIRNNELSKKLTHDTNDRDFLKKLCGFYDFEFQTGFRRPNEHFPDDFYEKQLKKYIDTYVAPLSTEEIESQEIINNILTESFLFKKKLI